MVKRMSMMSINTKSTPKYTDATNWTKCLNEIYMVKTIMLNITISILSENKPGLTYIEWNYGKYKINICRSACQ